MKSRPFRFVTAASLFDGHDAAINIMRRILQASGVEVIHLGHNRSAEDIVNAAIQEDVDAIAISSYQGGHNEFFKYCIDLLKKAGSSIKIFGGGGGTITPTEIIELEKYGVTRLYSPEDGRKQGLQGLIDDMLSHLSHTRAPLKPPQFDLLDKTTLPAAITWIETTPDTDIPIDSKKSIVVGMTGTGGAGKSSLTDELILRILQDDLNAHIAILAIDPTKQKTGGALLGDRLRINSLSSPRVYMRSITTRQENSSVSRATWDIVSLFKKCGFDWIFVETGGIGQADSAIHSHVDIAIYVMTSEFGAPTQLEKINMLDFADLVVINKFDKAGSLDALTDVRKQFRRNHREFENIAPEKYPVVATIASRFGDPGVDVAFRHLKLLAGSRKRQSLSEPFTHSDCVVLIPFNRSQYLAEVSMHVREYHRMVESQTKIASRLESLKETKLLVKSSESSKEIESLIHSTEKLVAPDVIKNLATFETLKSQYKNSEVDFLVRDRTIKVKQIVTSLSNTPIFRVSTPFYQSQRELVRFLMLENLPGYFPYTAGVFPFKREEEDPKRQFAGEGTPFRTNRRFHLLCEHEKAKRLSTAFDSVTLYGENPDPRPDIFGKIGESGVSVATLDDAKVLFDGFDLVNANTSVSMTINGPAPILLAFYFNVAIDQQVQLFSKTHNRHPTPDEYSALRKSTLSSVRGTVQADILKEDQAQNTCIFSVEFALRMMGDIQQYFTRHLVRNYYSVSISGYHIAEAGANPITQLAFTLANGFTYVEYYRSRGMKVDDFVPNFSFFFSNGLDVEYTVIGRVARRIWAIAMKYGYQASERSQKLKYHVQTSGRSLHAQEISFNDIRTTLQALLAYFDHCNSLHTNAYDEAVTTPTEESVRRAMAIQLIISKEFGWAKNENPLQGSFLVDELTALVEEAVLCEFDQLSRRGGVLGAMETHYQRTKIQEESLLYEGKKHSGEIPIIGVNTYVNPHFHELSSEQLTRASYQEKQEQIDRLNAFHRTHSKESPEALASLKKAVLEGRNIFAELMETVKTCSLGQISNTLYALGGRYRRGV